MGQATFLRALIEHGRVRVDPPIKNPATADDDEVATVLRDWEAANRAEFPGAPPAVSWAVVQWALAQFHSACQFAVFRDVPSATVTATLSAACPAAPGPSQHYSVDLIFRFLPDLLRLAKSAAEGDPLCDCLRRWAGEWPLSSVGIAGVNPADISPVCEDAGMLRLYVDRVIARRDTSRLNDLRVRSAVRAALGLFVELAPPIAAALNSYDDPCRTVVASP
jgi:hypothetical protein